MELKTATGMNTFGATYSKLSRPLSFRTNDTQEDKDATTIPHHRAGSDPDAPSAGRGGDEGEFRYRTIWISDVHLGTRGCKADYLLDFMRQTDSDYLYLVGDIVDGWRLKKTWYWNQSQNDVIQKILRKARKGTEVIYVPGNHDEVLRDYTSMHFGGVAVEREAIHLTADGQECGRVRQPVRAYGSGRGTPARRRRGGVRSHPPRRNARHRRRTLLQ